MANLELSRRVQTRFPGLVVSPPALCQRLGKILAEELLCFYLNTEKQSKTSWHGVPQIGPNLWECFTTRFTINFPLEHTSLTVAQVWQMVLFSACERLCRREKSISIAFVPHKLNLPGRLHRKITATRKRKNERDVVSFSSFLLETSHANKLYDFFFKKGSF